MSIFKIYYKVFYYTSTFHKCFAMSLFIVLELFLMSALSKMLLYFCLNKIVLYEHE